jgi:hypothetical protein
MVVVRRKERRLDEIGLGAELVEYDPTRVDNVKIARKIVYNIATVWK